jgi:hypothetical protein
MSRVEQRMEPAVLNAYENNANVNFRTQEEKDLGHI